MRFYSVSFIVIYDNNQFYTAIFLIAGEVNNEKNQVL